MCIYIHSWTTPSRPLDGRGVLLTLGGVGWGMYWRSCELADEVYATLWLPAGAGIHGWGGVGWGGAFMNVHVNLQMKYMLCCGCRQVHVFIGGVGWGMYWRSCELADEGHATLWLPAGACIHGWGGVGHVLTFMWTCRWRTCYAVAAGRCMYSWVGWGGKISSMSLSFIGHATLLYVLLSFALMGHATVLYVLLNFALMGHATVLYVLLSFAPMGHATVLYVLLNFALMRHATLLYILLSFAIMRHATLLFDLFVFLNFALMRHATLSYVLLHFAFMRHATLFYVLLNFACVMLRYCMFSWTLHSCVMLRYCCVMLRYCMFSWTLQSCQSCVMLRYCMFSWTLHSWVMLRYCMFFFWTLHSWVMLYGTVCSLELCTHGSCYAPLRDTICAHVVLAFKLTESRS